MMKLAAVMMVVLFSVNMYAGFKEAPKTAVKVTVKVASGMKDDSDVSLEGYVIKELKKEHYLFKDDTGEITVEIDEEDFKGIEVTPTTKIRIVGEVEKKGTSLKIDVDSVELVEKAEPKKKEEPAKKAEPKKVEPAKKAEPKKAEPKKAEPKKAAPKKAAPKKAAPKKAAPPKKK